MDTTLIAIQPRLETRAGVTVMGVEAPCQFDGPDFFKALWSERFAPREAEIKPYSPDGGYYSLYYCAGVERGVQVVAGMAVEGVTAVPEGLVLVEAPAGRYAVVETDMAGLSTAWNELNEHWLVESPWERADTPDIEYYPPSTGSGGEMPVLICIPVREREPA